MTKVLLYSGGMDSWLIDRLWNPDVKIYVDVDGTYSKEEINRLPQDVKVIHFPLGQYEEANKFIPLRNLYFLMLASNYGDELCLGATIGDCGSKDKTPEFFDMAEDMLNFLWSEQSITLGKHITIEKRFVTMSKDQMVKEYLAMGGNIEDVYHGTFSCFNPQDGQPCLACKPCFRRFVTLYNNGHDYSLEEKKRMYDYICKDVLERKVGKGGTYYKDRPVEGIDCEFAVNKLMEEFGHGR